METMVKNVQYYQEFLMWNYKTIKLLLISVILQTVQ